MRLTSSIRPSRGNSPTLCLESRLHLLLVEQSPFFPDLSDSDVLNDVKTYIGQKGEMVTPTSKSVLASLWVPWKGADFTSEARQATSTSTVSKRPSQYRQLLLLIGFSNTDSGGYLNAIRDDEDAINKLYKGEINAVIEPFSSRGAYVVARQRQGGLAEEMRNYVMFLYPTSFRGASKRPIIIDIYQRQIWGQLFTNIFCPSNG